MPEEIELRRVNWSEVFSFTHIFKSFKMAIHPSKLILCVAAIIAVFCAGWAMSWIWAAANEYVYPGEITDHFRLSCSDFAEKKQSWENDRRELAVQLYADSLRQHHNLTDFRAALGSNMYLQEAFSTKLSAYNEKMERDYRDVDTGELSKGDSWSRLLSKSEDAFERAASKARDLMKDLDEKALERLKSDTMLSESQRKKAAEDLTRAYDNAPAAISQARLNFQQRVEKIRGQKIFPAFIDFQDQVLSSAIAAVRYGNITGGLATYRETAGEQGVHPLEVQSSQWNWGGQSPVPPTDKPGFLFWVLMGWQGLLWLMQQHWLFATIFFLVSLAVVALFGGAVNRIAALHFAREEKISMTQALRFSAGKFFSFFTAPLIPLGIIFVLGGVFMTLGGLVGSIPYVGEILMGLLFFLAVICGLLIAFLLVGLVGGFGLMYPTIAVEGSDSFDAISRSFSYIYAQPWRAILYSLVALFYGVLTYLFVRLFAYLALAATHMFVGWGVFGGGRALSASADKLDVMWAAPTFDRFWGGFSWVAMNGTQKIGAFLIAIWVFLVAAAVLAYLLSFAASSTTVIYYLLRRKVDATDLDEVYVEEEEDALPAEPTVTAATPAAPPAAPSESSSSAAPAGGEEKKEV